MIKITRLDAPEILRRKATQWSSKLLMARTAKARKAAESKYRNKQIKKLLAKSFFGKCAYCESHITHVDYGHIEHFVPKSLEPSLTFQWSNLFLACGICNGPAHKGDKFPESEDGGPLVNPCDDEPLDHFRFEFDPKTMLASVDGITRRGKVTERILGLNRPELRAYRSKQVRRIAALARLAETDAEAASLLEQARKSDSEYAAFARAM